MKVTGLITEYNPFHNGHLYHLQASKRASGADAVVVLMSGNFVQRGTPAILDKWTRAEMALKCGADLVIELPVAYATASAELFALGAIRTLSGLSCVGHVVFGSESGNLSAMQNIADCLSKEPEGYRQALKAQMDLGNSFPAAREEALKAHLGMEKLPVRPNDILGIEYLKAGLTTGSSLEFRTIQRLSSDYHDLDVDKSLSSATAIRKAFFDGCLDNLAHTMPAPAYELLRAHSMQAVSASALGPLLLYKLRSMPFESLARMQDISEGLEFRIKDASLYATDYESLVDRVKTKRYVRTRIQRCLLSALLNVEKSFMKTVVESPDAAYARVLGFNDTGRALMRKMKDAGAIPLITNVNKFHAESGTIKSMLELDLRATDIYTLLRGDSKGALDRLKQPVYYQNSKRQSE